MCIGIKDGWLGGKILDQIKLQYLQQMTSASLFYTRSVKLT